MNKKYIKRYHAKRGKIEESNTSPQDRVYGGGGIKGLQAVGDLRQGLPVYLQGSKPNLQENNPKPRANDSFYLSTKKRIKKKK